MPNSPSAKKELRKRDKLTAHNNHIKKIIKEELKKIDELLQGGKKAEEVGKEAQKTQKAIDKAAKHNVISKNKANRMKSTLHKKTAKKK